MPSGPNLWGGSPLPKSAPDWTLIANSMLSRGDWIKWKLSFNVSKFYWLFKCLNSKTVQRGVSLSTTSKQQQSSRTTAVGWNRWRSCASRRLSSADTQSRCCLWHARCSRHWTQTTTPKLAGLKLRWNQVLKIVFFFITDSNHWQKTNSSNNAHSSLFLKHFFFHSVFREFNKTSKL